MAAYQISYDLQQPGQDYDDLYDAIRSYDGYCHVLESTWFVVSDDTSTSSVRDHLKKHIDSNDKLLVTKVGYGWATTFSNDQTDWMHEHL